MEGGGGAIGVTDEKGVRIFCHDPVIGQCVELHLLPAASRTNIVGTSATFTVSASTLGGTPIVYQWRKDGINLTDGGIISGATSSILTNDSVMLGNVSDYTVVITNIYGSVTSIVAILTVTCPDIAISPTTLPNLTVGVACSATNEASGILPDGVTLANDGILSGTPTNTGSFIFTVTDANGCAGSLVRATAVNCATITLVPVTLPSAVANDG